MAKKESALDILFDALEKASPIYIVYLVYLWFTNRAIFWRWVIYGIVFFVLLFVVIRQIRKKRFKKGKQWRSDRDLIRWLRRMRPAEFEIYIAELFSKLGYKTKVTGGSYDEGVDVVAEKDGIEHYIQCKKFITQNVTVGAVRDFYGAIADHLAKGKGYFITTNKFTLEAERFAEDKPIELIDNFKLIKYIRLAEEDTEENKIKVCSKCGGKLLEKTGKYGRFYGCSNYPKCQYTENIKK